jgi:hypothetical protein
VFAILTGGDHKESVRGHATTPRKRKPFSAYLRLSHQTGEKSARTVPSASGLLVIDHGPTGKAIGLEITAPSAVPPEPDHAAAAAGRPTAIGFTSKRPATNPPMCAM